MVSPVRIDLCVHRVKYSNLVSALWSIGVEERGLVDRIHICLESGTVIRVPDLAEEKIGVYHLVKQCVLHLAVRPILRTHISSHPHKTYLILSPSLMYVSQWLCEEKVLTVCKIRASRQKLISVGV